MDNNDADQAAREAAIQEATKAEVRIMLEKKAGETTFRRHIEASDARAALNGIAILIVEYARLMQMEVTKVLSVLAVSLITPALGEENAKHEKSSE